MKLTREQAIEEHRKMWLWISRQIMKDYVANESCREECLLYWNDKCTEFVCNDYFGYYNIITNIIKKPYSARYDFATLEEAKRAARMAYKIAMLPVKEK